MFEFAVEVWMAVEPSDGRRLTADGSFPDGRRLTADG